MKKQITVVLSILFLSMASLTAQNIAYYEPQVVLDAMPEYQSATKSIDEKVEKWQNEVKAKFKKVEDKYDYFVENEANLRAEQKNALQDEIMSLEKEAKKFKNNIFGKDGKLAKAKEKELQPIYDQVDTAIDKTVKRLEIDLLFAKSQSSDLVRANNNYNITNDIKSALGIK
jgi:Skp family chaperone for outer membrane proteins